MSVPDTDTLPPVNQAIGGKSGHSNGRRATMNFCPYCMGENLFPTTETDNSWQCRECRREFSVKFHGLLA